MELPVLPEFTPEQRKGLLFVLCAAMAFGLFYFFLAHGQSALATPASLPIVAVESKPSIQPSAKPSITPKVVVDIAGKVIKPGVYSLPLGSRAIDAIKAAGGAWKGVDLTDINLAHILDDGEQIIVGPLPPAMAAQSKSKISTQKTNGIVHINSATLAQLDTLPGIGPVMAARIIDYRKKNGHFLTIADLQKVSGMGAAKYEAIKSLVRL